MAESLEERIAKVEQEIERLKDRSSTSTDKSNWITDITGSFRNREDFDEILRNGREQRNSEDDVSED